MKKLLLGIATFITMAILCIVSAGAETYGDYEYTVLDDGTVEITSYTGSATELEIPSEIDGKEVTSIGDWAFEDCTSLTSVTIPDSVTRIDDFAFNDCTSLTSITIPGSVTNIGRCAFYECTSLTSINVDSANEHFTSANGILFDKDKTTLVAYPAGKTATSYTIPDSVTNIGNSAFSYCTSLTSINIPDSVTSIGDSAFMDCESLTSIDIPDSVTRIGQNAFLRTSLLNNQTTDIKYADKWVIECNYDSESATIKDGTIGVSDAALSYRVNLTSIVIPNSVKYIGDFAFADCMSLTSVTIPNSVTCIGEFAFDNCSSLESVTISNAINSIQRSTFFGCSSLTSVIIPEGVTAINSGAFLFCNSLTSITIPKSVTSIDKESIGYYWDESFTMCKINDLTINCYKGTAGEQYAINNGFTYKLLGLAPTAVKGLSLGGRSGNALRLNWTKNTSADGYIIEMYKGGKWTRIARIAGNATTTYRVTGLAAGTAYKFRMKAYKMDGTKALYSEYTSTFAARTNPSVVTGLKIGGRASNALRLNWTKNTSADGYIIEQYKDGKWVRIAKITSNATTTYRVAGLVASTQYKFRVAAYKMSGKTALYSGYTSTLAAYTSPSAVSNLKITGKAGTALRLGWSKNTSADGYIVEMYSGGKWVRVAKLTSNATVTYRKAGLKKGTTYKFRVATYNMVGKTALYGAYVNVSGTTNK